MKRILLAAVLAVCFGAGPILAEGGKMDHASMRKHCAEMMKDKEMMGMMMDCIASDDSMRMDMMERMNGKVKGDKKKMKALCDAFMKDDRMKEMAEGECKMGKDEKKESGMKCQGMMGGMDMKKDMGEKKKKNSSHGDEAHEGHH